MKSTNEVIQFVIVNELALRGNYILEEENEQGFFQKDPNFNEVLIHIPKNVTFRSAEIQNQKILMNLTEDGATEILKITAKILP